MDIQEEKSKFEKDIAAINERLRQIEAERQSLLTRGYEFQGAIKVCNMILETQMKEKEKKKEEKK